MTWSMKADEGGTFQQPPTGPQAAVLTRIIGIGTHTDESTLYGTQRRDQIIYMWELAEKMDDERPFTIQKFYTLSMHEKANLRKDLESWRGQAYAVGEVAEIDAALGKACLLNIGTSDTGKSKVVGISRLPKGMEAIKPVGSLMVFNCMSPDWSVYEQLSDFHQKKIQQSEEWPNMRAMTAAPEAVGEPGTPAPESEEPGRGLPPIDNLDDDIPF